MFVESYSLQSGQWAFLNDYIHSLLWTNIGYMYIAGADDTIRPC